jgi:hypothetical protein
MLDVRCSKFNFFTVPARRIFIRLGEGFMTPDNDEKNIIPVCCRNFETYILLNRKNYLMFYIRLFVVFFFLLLAACSGGGSGGSGGDDEQNPPSPKADIGRYFECIRLSG